MDKMKRRPIEVDLVVVGAGIVGLAAVASAVKLGLRVCCIDQQFSLGNEKETFSAEQLESAWVSALARPAVSLLSELSVWDNLKAHACPYQHMHVEIFGEPVHLSYRDAMVSNLGYILNNFSV